MPDQDDFEPLAKCWKPLYDDFGKEEMTAEQLADESLRIVTQMLHVCKGCPALDTLLPALESFWSDSLRPSIWAPDVSPRDHLDTTLRALERQYDDRRIDAVAIRTAQRIANDLATGLYRPATRQELHRHFATTLIQQLIRHCYLDAARANAVGRRFPTSDAAHAYAAQVLALAQPGCQQLGKYMLRDSSAQKARRPRIIPRQRTEDMLLNPAMGLT
jgi:hypothetical protein